MWAIRLAHRVARVWSFVAPGYVSGVTWTLQHFNRGNLAIDQLQQGMKDVKFYQSSVSHGHGGMSWQDHLLGESERKGEASVKSQVSGLKSKFWVGLTGFLRWGVVCYV